MRQQSTTEHNITLQGTNVVVIGVTRRQALLFEPALVVFFPPDAFAMREQWQWMGEGWWRRFYPDSGWEDWVRQGGCAA